MTTLTIRGVSDEAKAELRIEAARHGRSMEAELRARIEEWYARKSAKKGAGTLAHQAFRKAFIDAYDGDVEAADQAAEEYAVIMEKIQAERKLAVPREIDFGDDEGVADGQHGGDVE